jgi:hypothetical protein
LAYSIAAIVSVGASGIGVVIAFIVAGIINVAVTLGGTDI